MVRCVPPVLGLVVVFALAASPASARNLRAFATSVTGAGNISTWPGAVGTTALEKADAVCRARAAAARLPEAASYRAWISTGTTDAFCHVQGWSGQRFDGCGGEAPRGGEPRQVPNGVTPIPAGFERRVEPRVALSASVVRDEFGDEVAEARLLTGTLASGLAASGQTCLDWTSSSAGQTLRTGYPGAAASGRSGLATASCDRAFRLLCVESGAEGVYR